MTLEKKLREKQIKYKKNLMETIKLTQEAILAQVHLYRVHTELSTSVSVNVSLPVEIRDALHEVRVMDKKLEILNKTLNRVTRILDGEPCDFKKEKKDLLKNIKEREDIRTCLL